MRALLPVLLAIAESQDTGNRNCECAGLEVYDWSAVENKPGCEDGLQAQISEAGSDDLLCIRKANYGLGSCQTWDDGPAAEVGHSSCPQEVGALKEPWCAKKWCFVDPTKPCIGEEISTSFFFKESVMADANPLRYSYTTCDEGGGEVFARWAQSQDMSATDLKTEAEKYINRIASRIESKQVDLSDSETVLDCEYLDGCACEQESTCIRQSGEWLSLSNPEASSKVDFNRVTVHHPGDLKDEKEGRTAKRGQCLAELVRSEFLRVAGREYSNPERVAYLYYGGQDGGMFFQWPAMQWCPTNYDPRYRLWYVAAVAGPKDVVVVVDCSGSMKVEQRFEKAIDAVQGLLKTFSDRDYVGLVTFATSAEVAPGVNENDDLEPVLAPMTNGTYSGACPADGCAPGVVPNCPRAPQYKQGCNNKLDVENHIREALGQGGVGGTNFYEGFKLAFDMLKNSAEQGRTSGCSDSKIILFMTDGLDRSGRGDLLADIQTMQNQFTPPAQIPIFTYSFGDEARKAVEPDEAKIAQLPQKIACQNYGVAYVIPDGGDLSTVMTAYYSYFAENADPADEKLNRISWTPYAEVITNTQLLAGCKAVYDTAEKANGRLVLQGVVCMDLNVMVSLSDLAMRENYALFESQIESDSKTCIPLSPTATKLQMLRSHRSAVQCKQCDMGAEPCAVETGSTDEGEDGESAALPSRALLALLVLAGWQ